MIYNTNAQNTENWISVWNLNPCNLLYDISIAILVAQSSFYSNSHKAKEMFKMPQMIEKNPLKLNFTLLSSGVRERGNTERTEGGLIYTDFNILFTDESLTFYLLA